MAADPQLVPEIREGGVFSDSKASHSVTIPDVGFEDDISGPTRQRSGS